jgi:hypothetical protein
MGQPNPPGDIPLVEGLDPSWNEFVQYVPEDKRAEFAPKFKERISAYEPLKQWEDLHKSGITPDQAGTALNLMTTIENNPKEVYETIGNYLNITPAQAQEVIEEIQDGDSDDPRIQRLEQQLDTLAQIALAQRDMTVQEKQAQQEDAKLEKEISDVIAKYGDDVPEDEILMRMLHKNMTAEQAYQEYSGRVSEIRKTRPAPRLMGSGGNVPNNAIDVTKLTTPQTKNLVAQMLDHANAERKR